MSRKDVFSMSMLHSPKKLVNMKPAPAPEFLSKVLLMMVASKLTPPMSSHTPRPASPDLRTVTFSIHRVPQMFGS